MPHLSEKQYRRLLDDAEQGRKAKVVFESKLNKIVPIIAGGIRRFHIDKVKGVTPEQHNEYMEQIQKLSFTLESMPIGDK